MCVCVCVCRNNCSCLLSNVLYNCQDQLQLAAEVSDDQLYSEHLSSLENCPEMTVTLSRVLADGGEQKQKLTTKVHCAMYDVCYI